MKNEVVMVGASAISMTMPSARPESTSGKTVCPTGWRARASGRHLLGDYTIEDNILPHLPGFCSPKLDP
jgi:hypothetical protein